MKRVRQALSVWIAVAALCLLLPMAASAAEGTASLTVVGDGAPRGGTVTVEVELEQTAGVVGGSMEIVYPDTLKLLKAEAGALLSGSMVQINPNYTQDSVRVNFAAMSPVGQKGAVCRLSFQIREGAALGSSPVSLRNVRLYDQDLNDVTAALRDGEVEVQYAGVRVQSVEAVAGQSVRLEFYLEGALDPHGGSFTIVYDDTRLTAGGVVAGSILKGHLLSSNKTEQGILVNWAGAEPVTEKGLLCTVTFNVKQGATGAAAVDIRDLRCFDENGAGMSALSQGGTITLVTPTEQNPKLWVVGGAVDRETGKAQVAIVLEGRGEICGGSFQLTYPTEGCTLTSAATTGYTAETASVINDTQPGTIRFSWAGATPSVQSEALLLLEFQVDEGADGLPLELGQARMLDANGEPAVVVDIRSGKLVTDQVAFQLPTVDSVSVETEGGETAVAMGLDIASAAYFSQEEQVGEALLFVVFYQDGRMQTSTIHPEDFSMKFDRNGITQVQIAASCLGKADSVKVFLLDGKGGLSPLSEQVIQKLG